ncbi:hypothetical protein P7C71_g3751, partial [Lecanoromycetidae sp. Uapishka_2]
LTYHALSSHLLHPSHAKSQIAIIDTTGSFSPTRLRDVLVYRLEAKHQRQSYQQSGYVYAKTSISTEKFVEEAIALLDRVKVMRVFDLAGVIEAVGEVGQMIEPALETSVKNVERKQEIGDSEDDDEEDGEESSPPKPAPVDGSAAGHESDQVGVIIVDNIANVVSSLMSKSQTAGQALLVSFMRTLSNLTARHHICTILTNAVVGLASSSSTSMYKRRPEENVSIFASTVGKPALGKTFTYLVDTSIFLSTVPSKIEDAIVLYGDAGPGEAWRKAIVIEVVKDKRGAREGRWAAFEIVDEVKIVPCRR